MHLESALTTKINHYPSYPANQTQLPNPPTHPKFPHNSNLDEIKLYREMKNKTVFEGEALILNCEITGDPLPRWEKEGW